MAEKYGFFDAKMNDGAPDRIYSSEDVNQIYSGILSDGVFSSYANRLSVMSAGSGLCVKVATGKAIVKDHWYINTAVKTLDISEAHATLPRYTSVVIRYNANTRNIGIVLVDGDPATTPVPPTIESGDDVYDLRLADVYIRAGEVNIVESDITDRRTYSHGLVDTPTVNFRVMETTQTRASGGRFFDIPTSYNYAIGTHLLVYVNGLLRMSNEYTVRINEVEGNYMVEFNNTIENGAKLSFVMID